MDRRRFLRVGALLLPATYMAACDSEGPAFAKPFLQSAKGWNERVGRKLQRHTSIDIASPESALAGDAFPKYYVSDRVPVWDPAVRGPWTLEVSGLVRKPLRLSLDDLMKLPSVTYRLDHYCVEGWTAVGTWTGVRVSELARVVQVLPDAHYVDFQSFDDGYHESWDMESATHPQSLIAYGMDGHFLGAAHGGPARMYSPVKLGYKSTKYLTKVVFLSQRNGGYWSDQGYEWYAGT